ncbi:similar to An09g01620 [Aspergillus luchuensis]|uniref:Similar to An09g01620 n=1 Tax=Aspergillus kawachii TaxID=1069201 RepID=A0A146F3J3_ASPKA|nr:similar to An09g01620 [Aspergillus luchuensis]
MSATEQFTLLFFLLVNQTENVDVIHKTTGDWINLAQLFSLGLYYPSDQHSRGRKVSALLLYIVHLLVSVVPVVADAIDYYLVSTGEDAAYRNFGLDIFGGYHYGFIHPAMTLVGIYAWFPQNDEIHRQTQLHSLSETGLAAQAVIFAFVAISWTMRTNLYNRYVTVSSPPQTRKHNLCSQKGHRKVKNESLYVFIPLYYYVGNKVCKLLLALYNYSFSTMRNSIAFDAGITS